MIKYYASNSLHPNFLFNYICHYILLYILERLLSWSTSRIHPSWSRPRVRLSLLPLSSTCIFFVCLGPPRILLFVPPSHVSHVHPPLTTRRLNTDKQVKSMDMLYLIHNGHTHNYYYSTPSSYFFYILGHASWP